jgi:hypothetical protein
MRYRTFDRRGGYALEFALCMPIWFALMAGVIDTSILFINQNLLDEAANRGCRVGSLIDPGNRDQFIVTVENAAEVEMEAFLRDAGVEVCEDCEIDARTFGSPPQRSLLCVATQTVRPITNLYWEERELRSVQISRLEWQREAVP